METRTDLYDPALQMFVERPREVSLAHLRFLRWLGEQGLLEHELFGPPAGPDAWQLGRPGAFAIPDRAA